MNYVKPRRTEQRKDPIDRIAILRIVLIAIGAILIARLFYIQIIKHDYYQAQALAEHIKKFEISAPRGIIRLSDGSNSVPIVLNEQKYTVYADPKYITDTKETANKLVPLIGGKVEEVQKKLESNTRYVILAKKLTKDQADRVDALQLKGVGKQEVNVRTYPQGQLASQVLGFVNDDGKGQYGIEEYLNDELGGQTGLEKAVTDVRGIPLAVNNDNILKPAVAGADVTLTIDIGMQRIAEEALKNGIDRTKAVRGSVVIIEANTGAIKAMANYPTYDPGQYDKISDISVFTNNTVTGAWEPGSVAKPLLMGAAFTEGTATPDTTYFDPGYVQIDDRKITNSVNWGAQTMSLHDVINKSLNTGAVFTLKTLGGGEINAKARQTWYDYLVNHYQFNKTTGIEQSGESAGVVGGPNEGYGLNVRYANMAFGQGMTVTPLQLAAAYTALLNGGTYYKPTLIASRQVNGKAETFKPEVVKSNVVSATASDQVRSLLTTSLGINNKAALRDGYVLGAKSGTAQEADANGNYKSDAHNGVYSGFIGGDKPQYIMVVRLDEPKTAGFASGEAAKTWAEISNKLIDNFALKPKSS
jgi:cell division protein FtsI/penicillin-binding protein 2